MSDKIEKLLMLLIDKVDNMEERFEKRFDRLEKRLDGVEKRLDGVEKRLDRIENENKMIRQAIMELSETMDNNYIELKSEIKHLTMKQERFERSEKTIIQEEKSEYDPD
jgi:archaellum component FlaC